MCPVEFEQDVFLVVDIGGNHAVNVFLDASAQAIVAVGHYLPLRQLDADQLIFGIIGVDSCCGSRFLGLLDQVPVGIVNINKVLILKEPIRIIKQRLSRLPIAL